MLLPALKQARHSAYKIKCCGNIKQLYTAYVLYDSDFGRLPCLLSEINGGESCGIQLKSNNNWLGFGVLYECSYITNGKTYYCPESLNQRKTGLPGQCGYEGVAGTGDGKWNPTAVGILNNYWQRWNDATHNKELGVYQNAVPPMQKRLSLNSGNRWLATDTWGYYCASPSDYWMPHPGGVNILFVDGHALFYPVKAAELWACPSYSINNIIGTWGETKP